MRLLSLLVPLATAVAVSAPLPVVAQGQQVGPSGLPLPRFVSIKSSEVNVRMGPSRDHDIAWTFIKAGVPVEVTQEYDIWLRIRDSEGQEGWVQKTLVSGKRTALVAPWEKTGTTPLRTAPEATARIVAQIEPSVLIELSDCDGRWCRVRAAGIKGFIDQSRIWGAYPGEVFK